ncbi:MAG: hypothetical protein HYV09_31940 [Deltaproteobacteria bacterium]|nr:hypothetical protein [Deltaproteobacteria bacterium]
MRTPILAAVALLGSLTVACGGGGFEQPGAEQIAEPNTTSNTTSTNTSSTETRQNAQVPETQPVAAEMSAEEGVDTAFSTEDGELPDYAEPTEEETGGLVVEGREGMDQGLEAALAENPAEPEARPVVDGVGTSSQALLSDRGTSLANEARRIAGYTNRSTSYYAFTLYMNESTGTRRTDCSGLIAYILSRKQSGGYDLIPTDGTYRPIASDYFDYLLSRPTTASTTTSPRWRRILKPISLKPGDLVVYKNPPGGSTSGHVMMVKDLPYAGRSGEVIVPVVDSARSGHAKDTRGSTYSGPGAGSIGVKVDSYGKPTGYYWKGGLTSYPTYTKIVMGRLE